MTQCLVSPGVVNLCLAAELFLKSIIVAKGGTPPKSHKLVELSALVPPDLLAELRASFNALIPTPAYDDLLKHVSDYFVKVRYGYEFNIFAFHEHPVYVLAKVLYEQSARLHGQKPAIERLRV